MLFPPKINLVFPEKMFVGENIAFVATTLKAFERDLDIIIENLASPTRTTLDHPPLFGCRNISQETTPQTVVD